MKTRRRVSRAIVAALGIGFFSSAQFAFAQQDASPQAPAPPEQPETAQPETAQPEMAQPQVAQAAPEQVQEKIVITGSNIPRAESETAENVQVITAQQIQRSGEVTVADYLRTVSANFASNNETFSNSFAPGAAGIAQRGLSQKNTLVLLNGRRIAVYGFAQNLEDTFVDLNVIPLTAVDRIEVLKSGASAIYGSDATAGVVNIILKQNSTDRIADAGISTTTSGGGGTRDAALSFGFGNFATDHYNVFTTAGFFKRDDLLESQRTYTASENFQNQPNGYLAWTLANNYTSNANPAAPQTAFPTCGKNGLPGQVMNLSSLPAIGGSGTVCAYNPASQISLIPGTERANLTTTANFKISPDWTAFGDLFYSNVKTTAHYTPSFISATQVVYNATTGGVSNVPNTLPVGNPSNPNKTATQDINFTFQSVGGQDYEVLSNTYRVSGGVKGNWLSWDWEGAYGHSENHVRDTTYNALNAANLATVIDDGTYDFLNPLSTPNATNAIRAIFTDSSVTKLDTVGVKGTGTLYKLPAGSLDAAFGAEFRHESMKNNPDSQLSEGQIVGYGLASVNGGRSVYAAFAELTAPLVKTLEADLAAREEHYSDVGGNFSPQAALRWHPVSELTLRAVGSKGFRAPSLPEISNASATSFQTVTDPLDPLGRPSETIAAVTKANPELRPETSKNLDLGIVISPSANFNLSVDYYHIAIDHVIASQLAQNIVDDPAAYPGQIVRTPSGLLNYVIEIYNNQYQINTSGVDVAADATFRLPDAAKLRIDINATYVSTLNVNDGTGWASYAGTNGWLWDSPIAGGGPVPHWRGEVSGTWENPNWVAQGTVHYIDGYNNNCYTDGFCTYAAAQVQSNATLDLYGEYRGLKNWRFMASVSNVFNTPPPFDWYAWAFGGLNQPYDDTLYDARDRFVQARVQYKF